MLKGLSAFTIGQSHIEKGIECQDYVEIDLENKHYALTAAADGHGSKKHFRSDQGSKFATRAARESVYEYMSDYERFIEAYELDKEYLIDRIIKMIITKWHENIKEDLDQNPITQEEIDKYLDGNFNKEKVASIYGTTLLVGVMSEKCSFGFLIGDGSFVVIDKHGKAYIPIEDVNSKANYTSSMSSSDSLNGFFKCFFDEMPFSIMLSTDGLVKSFANDSDFLDYNQAIAMELGKLDTYEKMNQMEERLSNLFEQRSREGSEDDISISIIFDSEAYDGVIEGLQTRRKINKIDEQIDLSKKKINTLNFKRKQIMSERKVNQEALLNIDKQREELKQYYSKLMERKQHLNDELKKIEQEAEELNKKKIELDLEFQKYEAIEQAKKQEEEENLEDKKLEEQNIENKKVEKKGLEDLLNS